MGFKAAQWAFSQRNLTSAQLLILQRTAWSCRDADGFLPQSRGWLAERCALSVRSLERHLPQLEKLNLVVWGDSGFRLPQFLASLSFPQPDESVENVGGQEVFTLTPDRQIGGQSDKVSANLRKEKESTKEKEREKEVSNGRAITARPSRDMLNRIWAPIAQRGRGLNVDINPDLWDEMRLVSVSADQMCVEVDSDHPWDGWAELITRAAQQAHMLRGRRIVVRVRENEMEKCR